MGAMERRWGSLPAFSRLTNQRPVRSMAARNGLTVPTQTRPHANHAHRQRTTAFAVATFSLLS
jgi:hypothetical protein